MQHRLEIYIERGCQNCQEAQSIADRLRHLAPAVQVQLIDLVKEPHRRPEMVFAVPTYVLDGEIVSLGNPRYEALLATLMRESEDSLNEVNTYERHKNSGTDSD